MAPVCADTRLKGRDAATCNSLLGKMCDEAEGCDLFGTLVTDLEYLRKQKDELLVRMCLCGRFLCAYLSDANAGLDC